MFKVRLGGFFPVALVLVLSVFVAACGGNTTSTTHNEPQTPPPATVETPAFSPAGGSFADSVTVAISSATPGATIYYTLDGSAPTTASIHYTGSFTMAPAASGTTTVRAIAASAGMTTSAVASANYLITVTPPPGTVATPVISPSPGGYTNSVTVTISCATSGAAIYYSTDGSTPTTASTPYNGAFTIAPASSGTTTVRAIAARSGMTTSDVASAAYTVTVVPVTGSYVADYTIAKETVLRAIPDSYINTARTTLHVAYNHTSHGTHVSYGIYGLPGFKVGDATKFGITRNTTADPTKLDFHDNEIGGAYSDLSQADANWATWRDQVRAYLDNPAHAVINVMMWSWCDIAGHSVPTYLSSMQTLIDEYGPGGTKIGTGTGQTRTTPVTFIFMTGHANQNSNVGDGHPREQARLITDYCTAHGYYCIDYYSIDTHTMDDVYYEDTGDNGNSAAYQGNFYEDWQGSHALGADWYYNRSSPGGSVTYGEHNTQHITANRKAFAFWWVLARIAGYP